MHLMTLKKSKIIYENRLYPKEFIMDRDVRAPALEEILWDKAQKHLGKSVSYLNVCRRIYRSQKSMQEKLLIIMLR